DGKRLHRVALDDGRLFKRRSESIRIDAAIHISLDISSSMSPRIELAREAVLALVLALKRINGVKVSASAYPGSCEDRIYPIILGDRSALDTAATLSGLDSHDSTPMATGLWHAVHQVLETNTSRRLILMVTDGGPDIDHHRPVVDLVRRCSESGIDVVGLGISVQTVKGVFPRSLVISQLGELKPSLFRLAMDWLVR
ncbi:MAG: VWA domain-containing protein, partial [Endozoicomonas sp.]